MSAIGPGNLGAVNLAGSLAGAQRTNAESDRVKEQASQRDSQINRKAMSANSLEDVGQTDHTADRDADGRMAYAYDEEDLENRADDEETEPQAESTLQKNRRSEDVFGEKGTSLDIEA